MIAYIVWDVDPEIFEGISFLRWYGLCWIAGMMVGYAILARTFRASAFSLAELDRLTMYLVIGVVLGARLGHILFYDPLYYLDNPIEILPFRINPKFEFTGLSGLASHGGVVGALAGLYLFQRKFSQSYLWLLDRITICGAALGGFIRLGNLMNSEIIGTPTEMPWAFVFAHVDYLPRHPAQLYEAVFYFIVSITLFTVLRSTSFSDRVGFISGLGMVLIFTQRFFMEFLKENQVGFENQLSLNMGQLLSIPLVVAGLILMLRSSRCLSFDNEEQI